MFIENSDAFKVWLTSVLEPLCDADPEALAKYVFALVKKDKPLEELRECMIEQLDVFLQSETKPFVELLFKTLDSQEYLNNSHVIPNTNPPNPNVPIAAASANTIKRDGIGGSPKPPETLIVKEIKPIIPVSTLPNLSEAIINGAVVKPLKSDDAAVGSVPVVVATSATVTATIVKRDVRKSDSEKDESGPRGRSTRTSTRHRSTSRNRSRSRSWDRSGKRSRSRDRSPRIERRDRSRPWRNKSPPRRYERERERERRRSRSGSPRIRSRSRSPRHSSYRVGGRYRNRSPPQRSITRSRSRSNDRANVTTTTTSTTLMNKTEKKLEKDDNSGGATPTQDSNHGDTDMRLINTTQSIQSVVSAGEGFIGAAGKRRCRDFDEKGYCMRGEMCPYDHGVDPVVLEDSALSRVLTFGGGPNGAPQVQVPEVPPPPPGAVAAAPPGLINPQMVGMLAMPGGFHQRGTAASMIHSGVEYNPSAPGMLYHRPGFRPRGPLSIRGGISIQSHNNNNSNNNNNVNSGGPFGGHSIQRELINVPVMDGPNTMGYKRRTDYAQDVPPMKKRQGGGGFDFNRLGPRAGGPPPLKNPANCSLELKKVPRGMNNITHLNNHFCKFGKIVNIQVCFEGDPEGAIVTFSSHAEANAAYRSTEAVLNNRFIKVFWHTATATTAGENIPPPASSTLLMQQQTNNNNNSMQQPRGPAKERLGQPVAVNTNKVLNLVQPKATGGGGGGDENEEKHSHQNNNNNNSQSQGKSSNVYVPSLVKKLEQQKEDSKALANAAIVKNQEILAAKEQLKKKHEEKRKEALKITQDLRKRKQELLEKQLAQQKLLIEKLEKTNPSGQQRELLMSTIKTVQESIESIRKDMLSQTVAPTAAVATGTPPRKSKEEAQREVLDAELDLITRQQEGGDTSELQRRLMELRAQAYNLSKIGGGLLSGPGVGGAGSGIMMRRGRGAPRGAIRHHHHHHHSHPHFHLLTKNNMSLDNTMKRGGSLMTTSTTNTATTPSSTLATSTNAANKKTVIDHRPTRLLVSGYEADEYESVLTHFSQYGDICEYVADDSTPSIILSYRTRKEAEIAALKGKHFQDRTLSVTWCTDIQFSTVQRAANSRTVTLIPNEQPQPEPEPKPEVEAESKQEAESLAAVGKQEKQTDATATTISAPQSPIVVDKTIKGKKDNDDDDDQEDEEEVTLNTTEDQLLEGDDENISGEQLGAELSEEVLLQDDEEDLEEDEERSWRR